MPDKSDPQMPPGMMPAEGGAAPAQASQSRPAAPGMKPVDGPIPPEAIPLGAPMPPGGVRPPPGAMPKGAAMPPPGEVPEGGGMMKAAPGSVMPPGGVMPQGGAVPEEMMKPKRKSARPYIGRSLKLLGEHKRAVIFTTALTLIGALTPFLVSASFGPLVEILGNAARSTGMSNVWTATGSLYKAGPGSSGLQAWLATPLSFTTIFIIWAAATVGSAVLRFVQMWKTSNLEKRIISDLQGKVYDHVQTLSLDFF